MKFRRQHILVLDVLRTINVVVGADAIQDTLNYRTGEGWSLRSVYNALDQLETIQMVRGVWLLGPHGRTTWAITEKGMQCLARCRHI